MMMNKNDRSGSNHLHNERKSREDFKEMKVGCLILIGIVFHVIFALSIFDIYFRSPLIHGMTPYSYSSSSSPAKRIVLFVGDGLRADKFFELESLNEEGNRKENESDQINNDNGGKTSRAPFLRSILEKNGSFGVSHTRVPTESRPGHVALIAGFYEDVSAVMKGWKSNPVEFDSFFNESAKTYSFGSPDIVPMFKPEGVGHVVVEAYDPEDEDFSVDASHLDTWVFDRFEALLKRAEKDPKVNQELNQDKVVFFLHLLGIDTNGHAHRPYSKEYLDNIRSVDEGVKKVVERIESFYGDSNTAFVFTADHGMSNKGSHGDGEKANTETPLVVWGAGVAGPNKRKEGLKSPPDWGLGELERKDVNQADVAVLMAALLGTNYPLNSVGVLPLNYLNGDDKFKVGNLLVNAKQILAQFIIKSESKKEKTLYFRPFHPLSNYKHQVDNIEKLIERERFDEAKFECMKLIETSLDGLNYFQTYDWAMLMTVISFGYLGWISYVLFFVAVNYSQEMKSGVSTFNPFISLKRFFTSWGIGIYFAFAIFLAVESSPLPYYLYFFFATYFWTHLFQVNFIDSKSIH
eukprot:TRINITY_DN3782_c0_g1_i1.p1 TRINITY_DN3782_c0_g1~~TRINITY_DN3782_c0_g1_i1.p1  ORF type:complete len:577 (-),score=157.80 TRINITY_DN3782_c0_g1_i1:505-2235(-)